MKRGFVARSVLAALIVWTGGNVIAGNTAVQIVRFEVRVVHSVKVAPAKMAATAAGHEGQARVQLGSSARITAALETDPASPVALTVSAEDARSAAYRELGLSRQAAAVGGGMSLTPGSYRFAYRAPVKASGRAKVVLTITE